MPKDPEGQFPKMLQLVNDAKAELKRAGIETDGVRPEEILRTAREERNKTGSTGRPSFQDKSE